MESLDRFPRVTLAQLPTPLERLARMSEQLQGLELWVKRDDATGLAGGGNKARKLEYLMADAVAQEADVVLTAGGVQSNHVRQTAAAAARLGLACTAFLEAPPEPSSGAMDAAYHDNGNLLLDRWLGARPVRLEPGVRTEPAMEAEAERLRAEGRRPYVVPVGGSNALGALGYVRAALELAGQVAERGLEPQALVVASGSAGTHAGLLVGLAAARLDLPVVGICVSRGAREQSAKVSSLTEAVARRLAIDTAPGPDSVECIDDYVGPGYGLPTPEMIEAVGLAATREGLLLDPVYTGKAFAGLIGLARAGRFSGAGPVIFVHTGGAPALFAYPSLLPPSP